MWHAFFKKFRAGGLCSLDQRLDLFTHLGEQVNPHSLANAVVSVLTVLQDQHAWHLSQVCCCHILSCLGVWLVLFQSAAPKDPQYLVRRFTEDF